MVRLTRKCNVIRSQIRSICVLNKDLRRLSNQTHELRIFGVSRRKDFVIWSVTHRKRFRFVLSLLKRSSLVWLSYSTWVQPT